jgi:hypothetical protein
MKIRNVNALLLLIFLLSSCAWQSGLRTYVNSDDFPKTSTQVILDCSITTLYEENDSTKEGFSADFNLEVCEAFADEVRSFMSDEAAGKVLDPVIITLGAQFGGDLKKTQILIDESDARVDGDIELPMLDRRTIAYSALPQGDLPYLIKELTESEPHSALRSLVMYDNFVLRGNFNDEVRALPFTRAAGLVPKTSILFLNINGQKLTDSVRSSSNLKKMAQGVGTSVVTGLLTGGNYILAAWKKSGSAVVVSAVLVDESGEIVWTRTSGGRLSDKLPRSARFIFSFFQQNTPG